MSDNKKEQAKKLIDSLIKSIRQTILDEEVDKKKSEETGKSILFQIGAVEIDGRLTFLI